MNKFKFFLLLSITALVVTASLIYLAKKRSECACVKQKKFDRLIIHQDGTFDIQKDSICTIAGNSKGDLILTKIENDEN